MPFSPVQKAAREGQSAREINKDAAHKHRRGPANVREVSREASGQGAGLQVGAHMRRGSRTVRKLKTTWTFSFSFPLHNRLSPYHPVYRGSIWLGKGASAR